MKEVIYLLNLIDIASWQKGLSLPVLYNSNPSLDGVIVKLSQGISYVNPEADAWLSWLIANGKPFGTYHYLDKMGAKAEAKHYADLLSKYPGGVPAIDYEEQTLDMGTGYLKECLDEVYRLTGVKPLVYCSLSVTKQQDFRAIAAAGYKLWMAQYADFQPVHGFLEKPWQSGEPGCFDGFVMQQYTSSGYLDGWTGNLDFDQFHGDASDWAALAGKTAPDIGPDPTPAPGKLKGPDPIVISEILHGGYGNGWEARKAKLTAAGYDAEAVQKKVNELYALALTLKKKIAGNSQYLDSIIQIMRAL